MKDVSAMKGKLDYEVMNLQQENIGFVRELNRQ
jgi:hypothetical protein